VGALGGASVLICCDDDKWDYGRLGPISYDRLLQALLGRYVVLVFARTNAVTM
jgi:hypothetical protein